MRLSRTTRLSLLMFIATSALLLLLRALLSHDQIAFIAGVGGAAFLAFVWRYSKRFNPDD